MAKLEEKPDIQMTEDALAHFNLLIKKEEIPGMGLRMFVDRPGHPQADVSIAFCPPGEQRARDIPLSFEGFTLFVEHASVPYLQEAKIHYEKEKLGGQLAITAPHLKGKQLQDDASLADRVSYILHSEVNPGLASHGGMVSLVEITPEKVVVLRFGGGCHGCGMVDVTLKQGIEKSLMSQLPEITAVVDVTDHTKGENPYYVQEA